MKQITVRFIIFALTFIIGITPHVLYQRHLLEREYLLRENLFQMRREIDRYTAEKSKLPTTLGDLVQAGYIREIPVDPMTEQKDWVVIIGDDPNIAPPKVVKAVKDVKSSSTEISTRGTRYIEW